MAKSIINLLIVIPAVIFICYLALQLAEPSGWTVNHWISPTDLKECISALGNGDWHQVWLHASRTFTIEGHIIITLLLLTLFSGKFYLRESKKQILNAACKTDDLKCKANRLGEMGLACSESGQIEKAISYYSQSMAISRQIGDHQVVGTTLGNLGNAYLSLGKTNEAIRYHVQALDIFRKLGYLHGEASVLGNLGKAYISCGQLEKAIMCNKQSLSIFEKTNSPYAAQMRKWLSELENQAKPSGA